jgi:hypothetical protein
VVDVALRGATPCIAISRPLVEEPGQLDAAWRMAREMRETLMGMGYADVSIEIHSVPPTRVVRWEPKGEDGHAGDE